MELLAQSIAPNVGWDSLLTTYGPLYAIFAVVLGFMVWYGPRLVTAHLAHVESSKQTQESLATSYKTLTESQLLNGAGCGKTHRVLGHFAEAAKEATTCPDVHRHIDRALDELRAP